jgi:DNA-directed RNA polymerase specialized sigma24 family protein
MNVGPKTRHSLILRLASASDVEAWQEFVAFYELMIYRCARRRGRQEADAVELTQDRTRAP